MLLPFFLVILLIIILLRKIRQEHFAMLYKVKDDPYFMTFTSQSCVDMVKLQIAFISSRDACIELRTDIPYFLKMNIKDIIVKGNTIRNCNLLEDWTKEEKDAIRLIIQYAQQTKKCAFGFQRKIISTPWIFIKVSSLVENGFPHTHKDVIYLPSNFVTTLVNHIKNHSVKYAYENLGHVLVHEKTHVWQRIEPELFKSFYKLLNFEKLKFSETTLEWLRKNTRTNPDGMDLEWGYKNKSGKYYTFASLWNKNPNDLSDIKNVAIPLTPNKTHSEWKIAEKDNKKIIPITELSSWNTIIGLTSNHYHPNEISAEGISRFTLNDKQRIPIDIKIEAWLESLSIV